MVDGADRRPDDMLPSLEARLGEALDALRSVSTGVVARVSPRTLGARELARRLGLDKTLGWRLFILAHESDPLKVLRNLPGAKAWPRIVTGMRAAGTDATGLQAFESAAAGFERFVADHGLPRRSLASWLENPNAGNTTAGEAIRLRKAAFESARIVEGRSVRTRIGAYLVAGSANRPDHASIGAVTILDGPRLAPDCPPTLIHVTMNRWPEDAAPGETEPGSAFVRDLSTPGIAPHECRAVPHRGRTRFDLDPALTDRCESLHLSFLEHAEAVGPLYRSATEEETADSSAGETVDLYMPLDVPTERVIFDLLLHRDVPLGGEPTTALLLSRAPAAFRGVVESARTARTPVETAILPEPDLPSDWTGRKETYLALLDRAARRLGTDLSAYTVRRMTIAYPPPLLATHRWPLAVRG